MSTNNHTESWWGPGEPIGAPKELLSGFLDDWHRRTLYGKSKLLVWGVPLIAGFMFAAFLVEGFIWLANRLPETYKEDHG